jgi:hypothetical protein
MTMPHQDIWILVVEHAPATIAAIAALVASLHNRSQITALHLAVNSRLTELLAISKAAARAEGVESERTRREGSSPAPPRKGRL